MVMASERKSFVVSTTKVEKEQFWLLTFKDPPNVHNVLTLKV